MNKLTVYEDVEGNLFKNKIDCIKSNGRIKLYQFLQYCKVKREFGGYSNDIKILYDNDSLIMKIIENRVQLIDILNVIDKEIREIYE